MKSPRRHRKPKRSRWAHANTLYVPTAGRCDQHAVTVDGARLPLATATDLGRLVAGMARKRPSVAVLADLRRDAWMDARESAGGHG